MANPEMKESKKEDLLQNPTSYKFLTKRKKHVTGIYFKTIRNRFQCSQ